MDITEVKWPARRRRGRYSNEFKREIVKACQALGVSTASVALANGINPLPWHATREHCEWVTEINHLIQSGAEKISRIHPKALCGISEKLHQITPVSGRFRYHSIPRKASIHRGFRHFARPTNLGSSPRIPRYTPHEGSIP
jgi:hypothetical protein